MKSNKVFLITYIFLFFTLTTLVNIRGIISTYYDFYGKKQLLTQNLIYNKLSFIDNNLFINTIKTYTGLETGYGFFAPNVASDFKIKFTFIDSNNMIISTKYQISLKSKTSIQRVNSAMTMFLNYENQDTCDFDYKKNGIFMKGLAINELKKNNNMKKVICELFLYHKPLLSQIKSKELTHEKHLLIRRKIYDRKDISSCE